jgi:hypothetical protein
MPTLIERSQAARVALERARLANQTRKQLAAVQARASEWSRLTSAHSAARKRMAVFPDHFATLPPEVAKANAAAAALAHEAQRLLRSGADIEALYSADLWTRLLAAAEGANKAAEDAARAAWNQVREEVGSVEKPTALEARTPPTPANEKVLADYRTQYNKYEALVRQGVPNSPSALHDLSSAVERLRAVQAGLTLSAPEAVRVFLRAVQQGNAGIDLLTPEVVAWLQTNDNPARFVIKVRTVPAWG